MTWLRRKTQVIKESWERVLLEELFVFSGGLEGTWVTSSGWVPGKESQHNNDRAGVSYRQGRVSNLPLVIIDKLQTVVGVDESTLVQVALLHIKVPAEICRLW